MPTMKADDDIIKNIQQSLERMKGQLRVLESNVSVEKQMEYFQYSERIRKNSTQEQTPIEEQIAALNNPDATTEELKHIMVCLAGSVDVASYRALETYAQAPHLELEDWASMALMEARVALESDLSDEKQIFISTGLGGRGSKLRFFALLSSSELEPFSPYQRELVEREFPFFLEKFNIEIESLVIEENYITLVFLINFSMNMKQALEEAVTECNQYGDFLNSRYLITNTKIYNREEIEEELKKRNQEDNL